MRTKHFVGITLLGSIFFLVFGPNFFLLTKFEFSSDFSFGTTDGKWMHVSRSLVEIFKDQWEMGHIFEDSRPIDVA